MSKFLQRAAFIGAFISLSATAAPEKDLHGRFGIGFTNQIASSENRTVPALSAKYYLTPQSTAVSLGTGFNTAAGNSTMALGAKFYKNLFFESNLVFYMGAGLAYLNHKGSHLQGSLFLGSEFFLTQLPSLGFSFEAGLRGDNTSGSFAIRTTGDSFLTAGMHFYF